MNGDLYRWGEKDAEFFWWWETDYQLLVRKHAWEKWTPIFLASSDRQIPQEQKKEAPLKVTKILDNETALAVQNVKKLRETISPEEVDPFGYILEFIDFFGEITTRWEDWEIKKYLGIDGIHTFQSFLEDLASAKASEKKLRPILNRFAQKGFLWRLSYITSQLQATVAWEAFTDWRSFLQSFNAPYSFVDQLNLIEIESIWSSQSTSLFSFEEVLDSFTKDDNISHASSAIRVSMTPSCISYIDKHFGITQAIFQEQMVRESWILQEWENIKSVKSRYPLLPSDKIYLVTEKDTEWNTKNIKVYNHLGQVTTEFAVRNIPKVPLKEAEKSIKLRDIVPPQDQIDYDEFPHCREWVDGFLAWPNSQLNLPDCINNNWDIIHPATALKEFTVFRLSMLKQIGDEHPINQEIRKSFPRAISFYPETVNLKWNFGSIEINFQSPLLNKPGFTFTGTPEVSITWFQYSKKKWVDAVRATVEVTSSDGVPLAGYSMTIV